MKNMRGKFNETENLRIHTAFKMLELFCIVPGIELHFNNDKWQFINNDIKVGVTWEPCREKRVFGLYSLQSHGYRDRYQPVHLFGMTRLTFRSLCYLKPSCSFSGLYRLTAQMRPLIWHFNASHCKLFQELVHFRRTKVHFLDFCHNDCILCKFPNLLVAPQWIYIGCQR